MTLRWRVAIYQGVAHEHQSTCLAQKHDLLAMRPSSLTHRKAQSLNQRVVLHPLP